MTVLRFYLELVAYRTRGGARTAAQALDTEGLRVGLGEIARIVGNEVHVAPVVELPPGRAAAQAIVTSLLRASESLARAEPRLCLDVWPHLPDDRTRFLNGVSAALYRDRLRPLLDEIDRNRRSFACPLGFALDVEADQRFLMAAWSLGERVRLAPIATLISGALLHARSARSGLRDLRSFRDDVRALGLPMHVAILPFAGPLRRPRLRHLLLACPDFDERGDPLWERPASMCYTTLLRRLWGRRHRPGELRVLAAWARRHVEAGLPKAIVLGQLSHGVMRDEPVYDRADDLREDAQLVRSMGFDDVGVFSLEGLLFGADGLPGDEGFMPSRPRWREWAQALSSS
jgi:hypothetical protein